MNFLQIKLEIDPKIEETQVLIRCKEKDAQVEKMMTALEVIDRQILVLDDGSMTALDLVDILYLEAVDRKCFIYTENKVYEACHKLYELEKQLEEYLFVRINKSCIVNVHNIVSIKTYINRRLMITLNGGEQLVVSRQYADVIKGLMQV